MKPFVLCLATFTVAALLLLGLSTIGFSQHRVQRDFRQGIDSYHLEGMPHHMPDDILKRNRLERNDRSLRKRMSQQSQICVIDTAIVRSYTFVDTTRHFYSFNASGKRTAGLTQKLKGDLWVNIGRRSNTYDASGNVLSDLQENWENGAWVYSSCSTYTYDADGNMLTELVELWEHGQWVNSSRSTYTYDANGNMLIASVDLWQGRWLRCEQSTRTYDANGNMLTLLYAGRNSETGLLVVNGPRYTYTYDANGNRLTGLEELRGEHGQWVNFELSTYTYDPNGNMLSFVSEWWDSNNGQWMKTDRWTYTYDANGNRLSFLWEGWDWNGGQWGNYLRTTYTYDANGNILADMVESGVSGQWVNLWRSTYTYDANGNLTEFWFHRWVGSSWLPEDIARIPGPIPDFRRVIDDAGNSYVYSCCYNFALTYKVVLTGLSSEIGNLPAICSLSQNYPNPFNPTTTIKYELPKASVVTLSVYDMLGREVSVLVNGRMDAGVHEVRFDGSGLSSGMYVYRLRAGDYVASKRLVLMK